MSIGSTLAVVLAGGVFMTISGCHAAAAGQSGARRVTANGLVATKSAPAVMPKTELASFAAGCFWGVEEEFRKEPGVLATAVGYSGGHTDHPSYEDVCSGTTGHAESVRVEYDPKVIAYDRLLDLFWNLHDPTTKNRQGPDVGEQYRSVIFFFNPEQKAAALASRDRLQKSGEVRAPIVTEIVPAVAFTNAEEYHQQYVEKGGRAACHLRSPKH